ncbi:MAG: hypothetical protein ACK55Z_00755 [bacterium]
MQGSSRRIRASAGSQGPHHRRSERPPRQASSRSSPPSCRAGSKGL